MAQEILINAGITVSKGGALLTNPPAAQSFDMTGSNVLYQTQDVTTAGAAINLGLLTGTPKKLMLRNLGATNITVYGDAGFTQVQDVVTPGDFVLRSPNAALYVKGTTSTSKLEIRGCEA